MRKAPLKLNPTVADKGAASCGIVGTNTSCVAKEAKRKPAFVRASEAEV